MKRSARRTVAGLLLCAGLGAGAGACGDAQDAAPTAPVRAVAQAAIPPDGADDLFVDVTAAAGIDFVHHIGDGAMDDILEAVGAGALWFDADGDGRLDLYLSDGAAREGGAVPGARNRLYRNRGDGTFEDVTKSSGTGDASYTFMALAGDVDGDGDQDLYVLNLGPNRLFRNRGDGTFEDATQDAGVGCAASSVGGAFFDADGDGDLDLYVGNYLKFDPSYRTHYAPDVFPGPLAFAAEPDVLYLNDGHGRFRDASEEWGLGAVTEARAMGVAPLDFDGDGDIDLFVANDASANFLLRNDGGKFTDVATETGVAYGVNGEATAAMAGAVADVDGDGLPDIHVTDAGYGSLYHNEGRGRFADRVFPSGIAQPSGQWASWGGGFVDVDHDGDLDLFVVNGDMHRATGRPDLLLENDGSGHFTDVSARCGAYFRAELPGRAAAFADFDDDGDLDVLVTTVGGRPVLLRNRGAGAAGWITLDVRGEPSRGAASGARVAVSAGGRTATATVGIAYSYLAQHDQRLNFGLGKATGPVTVAVTWSGGATERFDDVAPGRIYVLRPGKGPQ